MILNPNLKIRNAILARLKVTQGQCPCVPEDQWNEDTRCKCKKMREEQVCCCDLYVKEELK